MPFPSLSTLTNKAEGICIRVCAVSIVSTVHTRFTMANEPFSQTELQLNVSDSALHCALTLL